MANKIYFDPSSGSVSKDPTSFTVAKPKEADQPVVVLNLGDMVKELKNENPDKNNDICAKLDLLVDAIASCMVKMTEQQAETTKAVNALVEAYKAPKTIIRDENGKPKGIE